MNKIVKITALVALLTPAVYANTVACVGCHGANFEKKAMGGKSKVVKDMSKNDIIKALKGYKDGSYGGALKSVMVSKVAKLDDKAIEALATEIKK